MRYHLLDPSWRVTQSVSDVFEILACLGNQGWTPTMQGTLPAGKGGFPAPCTILHYLALSCTILRYHAPSCTILRYQALSRTIRHYHALSCAILHYLALSCTIMHYLALSCTILHYLALSCTILHYLALSCTILQWCPVVPIRYTCSQQMSPVIAFI